MLLFAEVVWTTSYVLLYLLANTVLFVCYASVPIILLAFWSARRNNVAHPWVLILFSVFFIFTGLIHVANILVLYKLSYKIFTFTYTFTAIIAIPTVCFIPKTVLNILRLPTRDLIHDLNNQVNIMTLTQRIEQKEKEAKNESLKTRISHLAELIESPGWEHNKGEALAELRAMLLTIGSIDVGRDGS